MHALSFLQKRGHLSAVALGRQMFAHVQDMTPARFDLLHVIYQHSRRLPGDGIADISQARVRYRLGLARQTVWKMVKRLVELGLLRKWPHPENPRLMALELTPEGILRMRKAYAAAFTERYTVPPRDGGMDAPQHVHRKLRKEVEESERAARRFARVPIPHTTREERQAWWGPPWAPPKVGRDVAKVFTTFAWKRAGKPARGRRGRSLDLLDAMIRDARTIAHALGDQSELIYPAPRPLPAPEPPPEPPPPPLDYITWVLCPERRQPSPAD